MQQRSTYYDALLKRISEGDEQAFGELYNTYWKKVYAFLVRMTKSSQVAEELMLDIFTVLWTSRSRIVEINDMDAFLSRSAYNKALNFFRSVARQKKLQEALIRQSLQASPAYEANSLSDFEIKELTKEAIDRLPPQRKLIYSLSRTHGLTYDQIAKELELSPTTVKKTMSLTLRSLKSYLQKRGIEVSIIVFFWSLLFE